MMGVYIKGMQMLKPGVYTCELGVLDDNTAVLTIYTPINEPQKSYTLIPIQTHGRLIDADALVKEVEDIAKGFPSNSIGADRFNLFAEFIATVPTFIPAEEAE